MTVAMTYPVPVGLQCDQTQIAHRVTPAEG